jgi:hypothetical protein
VRGRDVLVVVLAALLGAGASWVFQEWRMKDARLEIAPVTAERDRLLVELAEGAVQIDSLEALVAVGEESVRLADSVAAAQVGRAHRRAQTAEAALREQVGGDTTAVRNLDELLAAHRLEVGALESRIEALTRLVMEQRALINTQALQIDKWRAAQEAEAAIARHWEAEYRSTQALWKKPVFWIPVTAVLTVLATTQVQGGG